jgi:hypothetical protein
LNVDAVVEASGSRSDPMERRWQGRVDGPRAGSPPIFVLGAPYSGKGLLGWALAQHPAIVHVTGSEWLARFAGDLQLRYEVATRQGRRFKLDPLMIDRDRFCRAFGGTINQLLLENVATGAALTAGLTTRWVDTTAGHSAAAPGLVRLFPGVRFIHLVRDPESAVGVLVRISAQDGSALHEDDAYEGWLEATRECLELELAFGSERVLRVHYDDLTSSPETTLRTVFSFIGESFSADSLRPIEAAPPPDSASVPSPLSDRGHTKVRRDAHLLMELLRREPTPAYATDAAAATRVEGRFLEWARTSAVDGSARSFPTQIQQAVSSVVPPGRTVAVISKGDEELVTIHGRRAWHFPRSSDGTYAGYHPGTSEEAIEHLESLRADGAAYVMIPAPSMWWLDHYVGFTRHLWSKHRLVFYDLGTCVIFALRGYPNDGPDAVADPIRTAIPELSELAPAGSERST